MAVHSYDFDKFDLQNRFVFFIYTLFYSNFVSDTFYLTLCI